VAEGGTGTGLIEQVERLWRAYRRGGVEALRELVDDDVVWLPYGAGGRELRGYDELAAYLTGRPDLIEADTYSFEEIGDGVLAAGHLRVRGGGALTDTQLYWVYCFRDGRLVRFAAHTSRAAALAALGAADG
jgi:ketosteroid isomerase-like protein